MDNLDAHELKVLNNMSMLRSRSVALGTLLQEIIGGGLVTETAPVNAVNAAKNLTIDGVVVHGETVTINNPLIASTDVYEFLADAAQTKTHSTNKAVDIEAHTTKSHITLTIATKPTAGDIMTIGEKEYTFVADNTAAEDGEINVGGNVAGARTNIVAAINGTDEINDPHPLVSIAAFAVADAEVTALIGGVAGDEIATTGTFDAVGNLWEDDTLGSGANCSAANAITALVAAITASDTQGVGAVDATGGVVALSADIAGDAGNDITLAETMAHGAFASSATKLSGGVDGTLGYPGKTMADDTYLYVCTDNQTVADKNWVRSSVGSTY